MASISKHAHDHLLCCCNPGATIIYSVFLKWEEVGGHLRERRSEEMSGKMPDPITLNLPEPVPRQTPPLWCSLSPYIQSALWVTGSFPSVLITLTGVSVGEYNEKQNLLLTQKTTPIKGDKEENSYNFE